MSFTSETTCELFKQAGWFEDRSIDITKYQILFQENGLPVLPTALAILREFGELRIQGIDEYTSQNYVWLDFDPVFACDVQSVDLMLDLSAVIKQLLAPVAMASQGEWVILVDENGRIYANHDMDIYYVADSIGKAIHILCSSKRKELTLLGHLD